ncbi:MAG TPA: response regulator [Sphingomicrobium sp.]|jgi:CheY-like chemotaxis protein|nr:response regulator [Sphingomicrobium sp.]
MSSQDLSTDTRPSALAPALSGRRILVVEDSPVVAPFTVDILADLGFEVVGPAPNMAAAREIIEEGQFDAALMDVHIRGERVFPLCEMLQVRKIPFVFTSGYADWHMPDKWNDRPRIQKPYTVGQVEEALRELLGTS